MSPQHVSIASAYPSAAHQGWAAVAARTGALPSPPRPGSISPARWNRYLATSTTRRCGLGATNSARAVAYTLPSGPSAAGEDKNNS